MYGFNDHRWADYYFESFAHTVGSTGKPYRVVDGSGAQSLRASSGNTRGRSVARGGGALAGVSVGQGRVSLGGTIVRDVGTGATSVMAAVGSYAGKPVIAAAVN